MTPFSHFSDTVRGSAVNPARPSENFSNALSALMTKEIPSLKSITLIIVSVKRAFVKGCRQHDFIRKPLKKVKKSEKTVNIRFRYGFILTFVIYYNEIFFH